MTNKKPAITVLMPAYNVEKYIEEAITSVLQQTFSDFELVIVNDGSTDMTENIIKVFNDPRIILINQPNQGVAAALNKGLKIAKGDYIARFDADDICMPKRFSIQLGFLLNHPDYIIIGSDVDYIDMHNEFVFSYTSSYYTNEEIQLNKLKTCPFIHSNVLFRKDAVINVGGYNIHAHTFEDHLLWQKILATGKGCNLSEKLLKVRLNPNSITIDEKWRCRNFHKIKDEALARGNITETEGNELLAILKAQDIKKIKEGSYYALLSKKYLWNNYQPKKARQNLKKTLSLKPVDINSYLLLLLSYMPEKLIQTIYRLQRSIQQ